MLKHVLAMDSDKICEASMYVLPKTLQTPHNLFGQSAKICPLHQFIILIPGKIKKMRIGGGENLSFLTRVNS